VKILYGVVGEGMGHAMRSAVILERLVAEGHELRIVGSGRAAVYLEKLHPDKVTTITGLSLVYEDNVVQKLKTAIQNLKAAAGIPANVQAYIEMALSFSPDVVISDFESWSYAFARGQNIPVVSVDNMQIIHRCQHDKDVLAADYPDYLLAKPIVKAKLPRANAYMITTFFYPPVRKERTTLHPPILRRVILDAKAHARSDDHVLVYQSGTSHETLEKSLKEIDVPFKVYGLRRELTEPVTEDNVTYCPFSEDRFIEDLATSQAVIAGGGFTLMGEAIYLGKPVLCVPLVGQFEQILNANYLQKLGYGERRASVTQEAVHDFLVKVPWYAQRLAGFRHDKNEGFLSALKSTLEAAAREGPLS
jgi:uncharacterized protein (TIGR00661 family)